MKNVYCGIMTLSTVLTTALAEVCLQSFPTNRRPHFSCPRMSDFRESTFCCHDNNKTHLYCCQNSNLSIHRNHKVYESETDYRVRLFLQITSVCYLLFLAVILILDLMPRKLKQRKSSNIKGENLLCSF